MDFFFLIFVVNFRLVDGLLKTLPDQQNKNMNSNISCIPMFTTCEKGPKDNIWTLHILMMPRREIITQCTFQSVDGAKNPSTNPIFNLKL